MTAANLLDRMRANPAGDWQHGLSFRRGRGTSHAHAKHPLARKILTIPARRPIKPVYIRRLVRYIEGYGGR
jgi:hypothetical protein